MYRKILLSAAVCACTAAIAACGQHEAQQGAAADQTNQPVNAAQDAASAPVGVASAAVGSVSKDAFIRDAAMGDMYEIQAAKIALMRTKNPQVKDIANMMIHDHTESTAKLKALLTSGKVQGTPPTELDERHKGLIDNLRGATDADFDARYLDQQASAHGEMQMLMDGYQKTGSDDALKGFASEVAPVVKMHIAMVDQAKTQLASAGSKSPAG